MNPLRSLDSFGEFHSAYHENRAVFIHHQFDLLRVGDFCTFEEIARATFKMPIINVFVISFDKSKPLRFVVITEDQFAHLIVLNNGKFRILSSSALDEKSIMLCCTLLVDQQGRPHLLFENGSLVRLSKNDTETFSVKWPPPHVLRVVRMCSLQNSTMSSSNLVNYNTNATKTVNGIPTLSFSTSVFAFENQLNMFPNSAAFSAYIRTESSCQITTWFIDFNENVVYPGPGTIAISYQSQYISPFFFKQEDQIYSTFPQHEMIDKCDDIVASSNYYNGTTYFVTCKGEIYSLSSSSIMPSTFASSSSDSDTESDYISDSDSIDEEPSLKKKMTRNGVKTTSAIDSFKLKRKSNVLKFVATLKEDSARPPVRIETNGIDFIYLNPDGTLISPKYGVSFLIPHFFRLEEYNSIMIRCGLSTILPFPTIPQPPPQLPFCTIENDRVTAPASGSTWKAPYHIVASNTAHTKNAEFVIVATPASIHILKFHINSSKQSDLGQSTKNMNSDLALLLEKNWDSSITAVAISSTNYAVASIDNRVYVASFIGEPYSFTFQQSLCLSLSLSETTLAAGFSDGLFILASLKHRGPIFTVSPFKSTIRSVSHVNNDATIVEWGEATGIVTSDNISWIKLPSFPAASFAAFGAGLLALGTSTSLDIYNFVQKKLIAKIPIRVIGVCCSGNRFFALTIRNELIVLYSHREITVDHQSIIDVDEPLQIAAVDETVYVLCQKFISVFDMRGHKLDTVEILNPPRYFGAASRGLFVAFSRNVWYISRDQSTKRIPHEKGNITGFAVIDDDRFVISTNSRLLICSCEGLKVIFSTITKITKKISSLKCYNSKIDGQIDTVFAIFEDSSIEKWPLPQSSNISDF